MRTVILVPRRADGGRRDQLWAFTKTWLTKNHPDWAIFEGSSPDGPFNRGAAINTAARAAGDWDIAIVHDGDNIVNPSKLREAVEKAYVSQITHIAHDTYQYLDEESSDWIIEHPEGPWWPRPQLYDVRQGYAPYMLHKHVSGVVVVPRAVWDKTGGFVELAGWGAEDSFHIALCNALGGGIEWVRGTALHLWHEHTATDTNRVLRARNRNTMLTAKQYERSRDVTGLKRYLAQLGHPVP